LPKPIGTFHPLQDPHEVPRMQSRRMLPKLQNLPDLLKREKIEKKGKIKTKKNKN